MYTLTLNNYILRDVKEKYECRKRKERIINHIDFDDYFASLATVLDLSRQTSTKVLKELQKLEKKNDERLKRLRDDLMFLYENYRIIKRKK